MKPRTCCVTGHRQIPEGKLAYVEALLREKIEASILVGYRHFIFGGAEGADLLFASIVVDLIANGRPLTLEAAIPYAACDKVTIVCQEYSKNCFFERNRYMVDESDAVIGVYDGRKTGGTYYTLKYARSKNKTIRLVRI